MSQFLSTPSSYSCSEVWCHTRLKVAMMAKSLGQRSWKGTHIPNRTLRFQTSRLLCQLQTLSAPPLTLCLLCLIAVSVHTTLHLGLCPSLSLRDSTEGSDSCGPQAHTTATPNPRTPCLPTKQAPRLRVPDSCDDYTTPSFLIATSLADLRYRFRHTLALADPLLTHQGLVVSLASALHKLFVRSCDSAHYGLNCSHVCAYTHHSSLQHHSSVLSFVVFQFSDGRTAECGAVSRHHMVESLLPHGNSALITALSPTATSWCELLVPCTDIGLHTGVQWHSVPELRVLPTGYTQCHQSTRSDGPHPHCHK